jgi:hypothetical protein
MALLVCTLWFVITYVLTSCRFNTTTIRKFFDCTQGPDCTMVAKMMKVDWIIMNRGGNRGGRGLKDFCRIFGGLETLEIFSTWFSGFV